MNQTNNNDSLHEDLALFALNALPDDEAAAVERVLGERPELWEVVDEYRAGLAALTETTTTAAPDNVWQNIVSSTGIETAQPEPEPAVAPVIEMRTYPRLRQWGWQAAAAAAVFALFGFGLGRLSAGGADPLLEAAEAARGEAGTVTAQLIADGVNAEIVLAESGEGYLVADNLVALNPNRTYQLWAVTAGGVTSAGVLGSDPGIVAFHTARASEVEALVITEENAGGVVTSEGTVIAAWGV